jgi:predicted ribosome quality control (RQC) complex YloA/Tae2 family protein
MKSETSALDLFYIVKELQFLKNGKLEKVFQKKEKKEELLLRFYVPDKGKIFLKIVIPKFVYLTDYKEEFTLPSGFAMSLRKKIQNSKVYSVEQKDFDRILIITFAVRKKGIETKRALIIELFGAGNVVLIDSDSKRILTLLKGQKLKERSVLPGKIYSFPKPQVNPFKLSFDEFISFFNDSKEKIVKILAAKLSLGGEFAEELCLISNVDKNKKASEITKESLKKMFNNLNDLLKKNIKGFIYEKSVTPFEFKSYDFLKETKESFCTALDRVLTTRKKFSYKQKQQNKSEIKLKKVENVLKKQKQMLKQIKDKSKDFQKSGEKIYEYYQQLSALLEEIKTLREKHSWKEIKNIFKEKYPKVKINEKNNELVVDL